MQKALCQNSRDTHASIHVISSALEHIFALSEDQIRLNSKTAKNIHPYISTKVSYLINQIGQLINEGNQQRDLDRQKHGSIRKQVHEIQNFAKDNMFSAGASVFVAQNKNPLQAQKEENCSIYSFNTSLSKTKSRSKSKTINSSSSNKFKSSPENQKPQQDTKIQKQHKNISELVSLKPTTKTGRSRSSAFDSSNSNEEKILEQLIDQYREQKIIEDENKIQHFQKKKKMTTLLSNDEMVLAYNYQGEFTKISKREFKVIMQKIANTKMAESNLFPGNYRFWKTKKSSNNQTQSFTTTGMQRDKNKKPRVNHPKRTSLETINEMKSRSTQVSKKKVLPSEEKIKFTLQSENPHIRHDSAYSYTLGKQLTEEQIKATKHRMDFLTNKLAQYHQKQQNFMPEWIQTIQNGCKVRIYAGKKQSSENIFIKNKQLHQNRPINQNANRDFMSFSQINPSASVLNQNLGTQIKCLSNLRSPQRKSSELMEEWERRKLIKTAEIIKDPTKDQKPSNKNSNVLSKKKSLLTQNNELSNIITNLNQQKQTLQTQEKRKNSLERKIQQDYSNQQFSNPSSSIKQEKSSINLSLEEFKIVKGYLQTRNNIFEKKESINKYRTESILEIKKMEGKKERRFIQENGYKLDNEGSETIMNLSTINEEELKGGNEIDRNIKRMYKVTLSQHRQGGSTSFSEKKSKMQGTINITNHRLKNSLLSETSSVYISPSSILYPNRRLGKDERQTEKSIQKSMQIHQLQKNSQSQKGFLSIQSSKKQKLNNWINYKEHSKKSNDTLTIQQQKSTNKKVSIIQRKNQSTILRANIPIKSLK